jgi:hypothetical protein
MGPGPIYSHFLFLFFRLMDYQTKRFAELFISPEKYQELPLSKPYRLH